MTNGTTPNDDGPDIRQATLLEDSDGSGSIEVSLQNLDGTEELVASAQLRYKDGVLDRAKAGDTYDCIFFKHEYWLVRGDGCQLYACKLLSDVVSGTPASANCQILDAFDETTEIEAIAVVYGNWAMFDDLVTDDPGLCLKAQNGRYFLINAPCAPPA